MSRRSQRAMLRGLMTHLQQVAARIIAAGDEHASIVVLLTPEGVQVEPLPVPDGQTLNDVLRARLQAAQAWGYVYQRSLDHDGDRLHRGPGHPGPRPAPR